MPSFLNQAAAGLIIGFGIGPLFYFASVVAWVPFEFVVNPVMRALDGYVPYTDEGCDRAEIEALMASTTPVTTTAAGHGRCFVSMIQPSIPARCRPERNYNPIRL
jgi:hypothetical protein